MFGPLAEKIYLGRTAESFRNAESRMYEESLKAEAYLNAHGSPVKTGQLCSQLEMSARVFSSFVCSSETPILGDIKDNQ